VGHSTEGGRVLVVDNYPDWRKTLRRILVGEGFDVVLAESRQEALDHLQAGRFDLIILDVVLEGSRPQTYEGLGLLRELEQYCAQEHTRVLMISGFQCPEELQEQLERPCVLKTLDKSTIELDTFVALARQAVRQAREARATREPPDSPA
jgi:CheY-like chemotaxis protein